MTSPIAAAIHPRLLNLIILPTEKCNFRCTYCYETFETGRMKPAVVAAIKQLLAARTAQRSLDHLTLSWFGGEPLLAQDVVLDVSTFGHGLLEQGLLRSFAGDVTTNGYLLTPPVLRALVRCRQQSFQISLDGHGAGHDATRRYASGRGTFDVIWRNLRAAAATDLDFRITLRCHLTTANSASMAILVDAIVAAFAGDRRFSVFFKSIENLGGPNARSIPTVDRAEARQRVQALQARLVEAGFVVSAVLDGPESNTGVVVAPPAPAAATAARRREDAASAEPHAAFRGYVCYASKPNSLMIRADGTLGKCTVLLDDPRNRVGRLNADGTLSLDAQLLNSVWMRGLSSLDPAELGCPAQNLGRAPRPAPAVPAGAA